MTDTISITFGCRHVVTRPLQRPLTTDDRALLRDWRRLWCPRCLTGTPLKRQNAIRMITTIPAADDEAGD